MRIIKLLVLTVIALGGWVTSPSAIAADDRPLLMEGKRALFQRVLAKPGATLRAAPESTADGKPVVPFAALYVYARKSTPGTAWLQVGADSHGTRIGWVAATDVIEWNQGLTLSFRDPGKHNRVLLFRDRESLKAMTEDPDRKRYEQLYNAAVKGNLPDDAAVVAIQPAEHVDILKDFYLVPISAHEDVFIGAEQGRMLKVSTVPLRDDATAPPAAADAPATGTPMNTGVAFVIDTTRSMQPYIERTREAVRKILGGVTERDTRGSARFALVAYRDEPAAVPGVEYLTRTYAPFADGASAATFLPRIADVRASRVSTREFNEDVYAGLKHAIDTLDWHDLVGKHIVLITDAGARDPGNPNATTGLDAVGIRKLAQEKGITVTVLHLLTPQGQDNHVGASQQYKTLATIPDVGELYYGVDTGDVDAFGKALDGLTAQLSSLLQQDIGKAELAAQPAADPQLAQLQSRIAKLGHALRLQYLQKPQDGQIPALFDAWLLDRDLRKPERRSVDVRVLLTRDQLSDLHDMMRRLLQTFEDGLISPRGFLEELKTLAATVSRDPQRLAEIQEARLSGLGFMQEYVEDLPYRGEIMDVALEDWESWPPARQLELIHRLEEKIAYYKAVHDHTDLWIALDGGAVGGSSVFPIELEMLP
ncbi:MAG: VWA domain-containing protein [Thiotrichales bacterium]